MKKKRKILTALIIIAAILVCLIAPGLYNGIKIQHYTVESDKINSPVRIALVTDTHSCKCRHLTEYIYSEKPDIILLGGDIFDDELPDDNAIHFLDEINETFPCYYVAGNHEFWSGQASFDFKMWVIEDFGIKRLAGTNEIVTVNGQKLNLCGVDDPDTFSGDYEQQLKAANDSSRNGLYTILLAHRPERMPEYRQYDFDLVLAGHAHGGQWRIPFLINGLYSPFEGIFPKYAGGEYDENGTKMIVSRGLAVETTLVPRIYNRPELVIIDLK